MARPVPSGAVSFTITGGLTSGSSLFTAVAGRAIYVVVFGRTFTGSSGTANFAASATFGGVPLTQWASKTSTGAADVMRVWTFSLPAADVVAGIATLAFTCAYPGADGEFTVIAFNVSNAPLNGAFVLPGLFYQGTNVTTLTRTAYAWNAGGTQIAFAWGKHSAVALTLAGGTEFVSAMGAVGNYQDATDGELSYTTTLGVADDLGLFSFCIPPSSDPVGGSTMQVMATGLTTLGALLVGESIVVGLPYATTSQGEGREGNIIPRACTFRSMAYRVSQTLGAGNKLRCEIVRGGYDCGTQGVGFSYVIPTGISLDIDAASAAPADQTVLLDAMALRCYGYERLGLRYTNVGTGTIATGKFASVAFLVEHATRNVQIYGGGPMRIGSVSTNVAYYKAPLHPLGTLNWQTDTDNDKSLVGIAATVNELLVQYQDEVVVATDHQYYMQNNGVLQDGTGGTVDTVATTVPASLGPALARRRFTETIAPADLFSIVGFSRDAASADLRQAATIVVTASVDGEFMLSGHMEHSASGDRITSMNSAGLNDDVVANESELALPVPPMTFAGADVHVLGERGYIENNGPSASETLAVRLRKNLAATAMPDMVFATSSQTAVIGGDVSYTGGDLWSSYWAGTGGTPYSSRQFYTIPGFITPPPVPGSIVVQKDASGDVTQLFDFTAGGMVPATFSLAGGQSQSFQNLAPGSGYSVGETVPFGWQLTSAVASNGSPITNIVIAAGEVVTVIFTNRAGQGQDGCPIPGPSPVTGQNACPAPNPAVI